MQIHVNRLMKSWPPHSEGVKQEQFILLNAIYMLKSAAEVLNKVLKMINIRKSPFLTD